MKTFLSVIDQLSDWSGKIFSFLWIAVIIVIVLEVVLRYGFNAPTKYAHELTAFLCAVVYILGGAYTLYLRGHVSVDIFYNRFSPRGRALLDVITFPTFIIYIIILLWSGFDRAWGATIIGETSGSPWNPPIYPVLLTIPLGALLIFLQGLAKFIRDFTVVIKGKEIS